MSSASHSPQRAPIAAAEAPARSRQSIYPAPFSAVTNGRLKRPLGDLFGIKNFGVNHTRLAPGAASALRHAHSRQDEFVYVLEGQATLRCDAGEHTLGPGMCVGFAAGTGEAHQFVNRSDADVILLEIGDRSSDDEVAYPEDDLLAGLGPNGQRVFTHRDGTPYE
jgi:uncharacterized cupin superfamily protein